MNVTAYAEQHHVAGEKLLSTVRTLIHEGNVRRVVISDTEGNILLEFPLTVGVVGAVLGPVWVALGAIAALAADYRIGVERMAFGSHLPQPDLPLEKVDDIC